MPQIAFDADYYATFYDDPDSRAVSPEEQALQIGFVAAYLKYLELPVASILDIGCGRGQMLGACAQQFEKARLTGVEYSDYLCEAHGWSQGSVVDYQGEPHDLVICHDVLGYLSKKDCAKAVKNLAKLTGSVLYISVLTEEDLPQCDTERTDMRQKVRSASFYRELLDKRFVGVGGGLYLKKPLAVPVWHLERCS